MSTSRRFVVAIAVGVATSLFTFLCLMLFPTSLVGSAIAAVGMPLAAVLFEVVPSAAIHVIAPKSGVVAAGAILAISTLLTWFAIVSTSFFFLSRRFA
jgi:hypothetical protein